MKYTVYFATVEEIGVDVEANDDETAVDLAYEELPSGLCAQCSGYGASWQRAAEGHEATSIVDADGNTVWEQPSDLDIARKQLAAAEKRIRELKAQLAEGGE